MSKLVDWIEKLSARAEKNRAALDVSDDSALGRFATKVESRAEKAEAAAEGEEKE